MHFHTYFKKSPWSSRYHVNTYLKFKILIILIPNNMYNVVDFDSP